MSMPAVKNEWTLGTVLASATSIVSLLSMVFGGIWIIARISDTSAHVPPLIEQQAAMAQQIAVLQDQQHYTDLRYAEIMTQLASINQKLDEQQKQMLMQYSNRK